RLLIFFIGFIVFVALIGYSLSNRSNVTFVERIINDSVGWVQQVIHVPVTFVTGVFSNIEDIKNTYNENQILRERLGQYKSLIYEVQELEKENERLRESLGLLESDSLRDFNTIQATVISRSPEQWLDEVTVN